MEASKFRETHLTGVGMFKQCGSFFFFLLEARCQIREAYDSWSSCLHTMPVPSCLFNHVLLKMWLGESRWLATRSVKTGMSMWTFTQLVCEVNALRVLLSHLIKERFRMEKWPQFYGSTRLSQVQWGHGSCLSSWSCIKIDLRAQTKLFCTSKENT